MNRISEDTNLADDTGAIIATANSSCRWANPNANDDFTPRTEDVRGLVSNKREVAGLTSSHPPVQNNIFGSVAFPLGK
jgi:hypothetical protein